MQLSEFDYEEMTEQKSNNLQIEGYVKTSASFMREFPDPDRKNILKHLEMMVAGGGCGDFNANPYIHAFNAGKRFMFNVIIDMLNEEKQNKRIEYLKGLEDAGRDSDSKS